MRSKNCLGLTLIELLVVVLIIGILAAIAIPQYQFAVEKSRAAEGLTNLKSLISAVEIYRLETGNYPAVGDWDALIINFPGQREYYAPIDADVWRSGDWRYYLGYNNNQSWARKGGTGAQYYISFDHETRQYVCGVYSNNSQKYEKICKDLCQGAPFTQKSDRKICVIPL